VASVDDNHPALTQLRSWLELDTSLELHFSGSLGVSVTIPVSLVSVSTSEVRFRWSLVSPASPPPLMITEGTASVLLDNASIALNAPSSGAVPPNAPVQIWRDTYCCNIRPFGI
jgi:hypothetical protein